MTLPSKPNAVDDLLQAGISAARAGHDQWARDLLARAVELDGDCLEAWLWLSQVAASPVQKEHCLEQVLRLDPDHEMAHLGLSRLRSGRVVPGLPLAAGFPSAEPVPVAVPARAGIPADLPGPTPTGMGPARSEGTLGGYALPVPDMDELVREGIAAARSQQAERARKLLGRVIEVDEKHVSAWLWLSYVADSPAERDRCLRKVITSAVPGATADIYPAVEWPGDGSMLGLGLAAAPAYAYAPATSIPAARPLPRTPLPEVATLTQRLRAIYLEWATTWTVIALAYLALITLAEIVITFLQPRAGVMVHSLVLLALLVHAARVDSPTERAFLVSLAFAPLIRLISLSLPLAQLPLMYWYLITSIPIFAAVLIAAPTLGLSWPDMGLNLRRWGLQLVIALSGLAFGVLEYFILQPKPLVQTFTWRSLWLPALILLVSTGLLEEMVFRGLLQRTSINLLSLWGIGYVAVLFAVLHIGYRSLLDVVFVLAVGLFFGWIVHRTRSLLGVTLSHGLTNIVLFLVMPFLHG